MTGQDEFEAGVRAYNTLQEEKIAALVEKNKTLEIVIGRLVGCGEKWKACSNFNTTSCELECGNDGSRFKDKKNALAQNVSSPLVMAGAHARTRDLDPSSTKTFPLGRRVRNERPGDGKARVPEILNNLDGVCLECSHSTIRMTCDQECTKPHSAFSKRGGKE